MDTELIHLFAPVIAGAVLIMPIAWVLTTWLRVRHGYPLEGAWGQKLEGGASRETRAKLALVEGDNARLRGELAGIKERLAVLERIATDAGGRLSADIESLRVSGN